MEELDHAQYQAAVRRSIRVVARSSGPPSSLATSNIYADKQLPIHNFKKTNTPHSRLQKRRRTSSSTIGRTSTDGVSFRNEEYDQAGISASTREQVLFPQHARELSQDLEVDGRADNLNPELFGIMKLISNGMDLPLDSRKLEHDKSGRLSHLDARKEVPEFTFDKSWPPTDNTEGPSLAPKCSTMEHDTPPEIEEERQESANEISKQDQAKKDLESLPGHNDAMEVQAQECPNNDPPATPRLGHFLISTPPLLKRSSRVRRPPALYSGSIHSGRATVKSPFLRAKRRNVQGDRLKNPRKRIKTENFSVNHTKNEAISSTSKTRPKGTNSAVKKTKHKPHPGSQELIVRLPIRPSQPQPASACAPPDPQLVALSRKLTARLPIGDKPTTCGQPSVWADSRQALCETVPYFKTPQGGCHSNDGHVYAFYFDGDGGDGANARREYMDTDVIIARARGGMGVDRAGNLTQCRDHAFASAVTSPGNQTAGLRGKSAVHRCSQPEAVLNNIRHQNPVVVICGDRHAGAICRMPRKFCVLGWFKPVAVWTEKTQGRGGESFKTVKYRLERLKSREPWFAPKADIVDSGIGPMALTLAERELAGPVVRACCRDCRAESPQVYLIGWMCLQHNCPRLWRLGNDLEANCGAQDYAPAFLLSRTTWANEAEPYDARVPVPTVGDHIGDNLAYINTRGVCCPQCGRCNSRRLFKGWQCENPDCDWKRFPKHFPVRPAHLHNPWETFGTGPTLGRNVFDEAHVKLEVDHRLGFKIYRYTFTGVEGSLTHIASNAYINALPNGPDDMLAALQHQDDASLELPLERRVFAGTSGAATGSTSKSRKNQAKATQPSIIEGESKAAGKEESGDHDDKKEIEGEGIDDGMLPISNQPQFQPGDLMSAFSINYGMPYKFVASGASLPFHAAPWPIQHARADLNWASINLVPSPQPRNHDSRQSQDTSQQTEQDDGRHQDFNEQLIFAYLEKQKLDYHDDGEVGLGSRIATHSLGASARMHIRLKRKHAIGCSRSGVLTAERPLPGGPGGTAMDAERLAAWTEIEALPAGPEKQRRRRELPRELGLFPAEVTGASAAQSDRVVLTLNHGDMVIMAGRALQTYFEHKVQSTGYLRFALTCRTVLPEHLTAEERPAYDVPPDRKTVGALMRLAQEVALHEQQQKESEKTERAALPHGEEVLTGMMLDLEDCNE